ncbi:uncharacterized protein LOC125541177 [Triticum urartu]|uniref:uncharacterized protein LOC125540603 n=1 Tax=Triticum urartu TaxID=4572 RepID=UPI0020443869|nr:uncharacterized protein LOC125540603 [Triticum urartu]XP_048560599.1 uncharacterized protein LOC125541177 [Triticum urartu]
MEAVISVVTGELVSRFISFLKNKYNSSLSRAQSEKMEERLQDLLMRVSIVIEEADVQYITNSGMLLQLKMLSGAMYKGYCMLDTLRFQNHQESACFDQVRINDSSSNNLYLSIPFKRSRTKTEMDDKAMRLESDGALESLEIVVANMTEFVVFLGGCERMSRRPYDIYLHTNNFMFSRHAEKQNLLTFLLEHNDFHAPAVLPIIGGVGVGKKTLVAHVCADERVRSQFSTTLHLNGDNLLTVLDHGGTMFGMILVVIEFVSDIGDDDSKKFHLFLVRMNRGSKIIIISKLKGLARFGSVHPIFLSVLSYDEFRYLFKTLAFGSVDPAEHPRLLELADEFANQLHNKQGSLVAINTFSHVLRMNLTTQFWCCIFDKMTRHVKRNLYIHGAHPSKLMEQGLPVDITDFALHPLTMTSYTSNIPIKEESPSVTFAELLANPSVRPEGDFTLIRYESRIPPHKSFVHLVTSRAQDTHEGSSTLPGRKRRGVPI